MESSKTDFELGPHVFQFFKHGLLYAFCNGCTC